MASKGFISFLWASFILSNLSHSSHSQTIDCGAGWSAYRDEKCIKLIDTLVTYADAEATCKTEVGNPSPPIPPLLTSRSTEEQTYLTQSLFDDSAILENVWLGGLRVGDTMSFAWTDGTPFTFTNWRGGFPSSNLNDDCVQMTPMSLKGTPKAVGDGYWTDVSCLKRNLVVCQKMASWTLADLQRAVLELRADLVPIGFVYIQLPNQPDAGTVWPGLIWQDVTKDYAGLFFRAEGGESLTFGAIQNDQTRGITQIDSSDSGTTGHPRSVYLKDGQCSEFMFSGYAYGHDYDDTMRFCTNAVEVRPKNTAVRIFKRTA